MHICRPVTVVQDTAELLAVWMAPSTEFVRPVLANGTQRTKPLATRYTAPRTTARSTWFGTGVLKLARPGDPWSVWLFWDRGWLLPELVRESGGAAPAVGRRGGFRGRFLRHLREPGPELEVAGVRGRVRDDLACRHRSAAQGELACYGSAKRRE
ncbi:hypothetical protein SMICM304S_08360 [Streptomyces microflavus]